MIDVLINVVFYEMLDDVTIHGVYQNESALTRRYLARIRENPPGWSTCESTPDLLR
jgi:hypothetical protein